MNIEKPPIGLIPEQIWKERRLSDINEVLQIYIKTNRPIPEYWISERNQILSELQSKKYEKPHKP